MSMTSTFVIVISVFVIINYSIAIDLTCSNKFEENLCQCQKTIDADTDFPETNAYCTNIGLTEFPNIRKLVDEFEVSEIDMSVNTIERLEHTNLKSDTFKLHSLLLHHNGIGYIEPGFFVWIPNLRKLDLSYNNITAFADPSVFLHLTQLTTLDLSFNQIQILAGGLFTNVIALNKLNLSYNPLGNQLEEPTVLTKLGLSENVTHLNLDHVEITQIHPGYFSGLPKLKHLSLADNSISDVPQASRILEYLDLSGTNFTFIQETYLDYPLLKTLRMNRLRNLENLHKYAFYNMPILEELSLTDCPKLTDFNKHVFGLLTKYSTIYIRRIDLSRNGMQALDVSYKYLFDEVDHVVLGNNDWHCDCDLLWMLDYSAVLTRRNDIRCSGPVTVRNKLVLELEPSDLPDCYPEIYGKKGHRILLVILIVTTLLLSALISYLCYYSPLWSKNLKHTIVGTDSPYSTH